MKRKKRWLRWIAWTLLLVLCMNSAGTTVLAVSVEEENIPNINSTQEGEMRTEDFIPEESTSLSEETSERRKYFAIRRDSWRGNHPAIRRDSWRGNHPAIRRDSGGRNYSIHRESFQKKKKPSRSRLHKRNHRNFRRFPKDLILISMLLSMEIR